MDIPSLKKEGGKQKTATAGAHWIFQKTRVIPKP